MKKEVMPKAPTKILSMMILLSLILTSGVALAANNPLDEKAAKADRTSIEELVTLGDLYVEAMRLSEAKDLYRAALKLDKKYGEAQFGMIRLDMAKGKLEKTKQACRVVGRRNKTKTVGEICSGWVWLTFDRSARAIDEFNKALAKGDIARSQTGLGEAYRRSGQFDKSIKAYNAAISAGAGYIAHRGLGLSLESQGNKNDALASLKKAAEKEPASCLAHFDYGRVLNGGTESIDHLQTAVAIRPSWAEGFQILGEVFLGDNKLGQAKTAFDNAIDANPKRGISHLGLGKVLFAQAQPTEARSALKKALELVPNLLDAYLLLADIEYAIGNSDAALETLDKASHMAPGVFRVYMHSGEIYFKMKRYTTANSYLRQAIAIKSNSSKALEMMGDIACERRMFTDGQRYYKKALEGNMEGVSQKNINKKQSTCKTRI